MYIYNMYIIYVHNIYVTYIYVIYIHVIYSIFSILCISYMLHLSPDNSESKRLVPTASSSSMKIIAPLFFEPCLNIW